MKIKTAFIAATLLFAAQGALAVPYFEGPDAPPLLPGQALPDGTTSVIGALAVPPGNTPIYVDVYGFSWGGGSLTIDTFGSSFDTQLHLFDALGFGVLGNDDPSGNCGGTFGFQSCLDLTGGLGGGLYYLAISAYNNDPLDATDALIFGSGCCGTNLPVAGTGPLAGWTGSAFSGGAYEIHFSSAVGVPEPGTLSLLGLGLVGIAAARRRRKA